MSHAANTTIYCLVPRALAGELLDSLREHYRADPFVRVVVDRREGDRRSRRAPDHEAPVEALRWMHDRTKAGAQPNPSEPQDRRPVQNRRSPSDRRRPVVPRRLVSTLPPELARYADRLQWSQHLAPVRRRLQDSSLHSVVCLVAAGDEDANSELYWRCAPRVRSRLGRSAGDREDLGAALREAYGRVLDRLERVDLERCSLDELVESMADAVTEIAASGAQATEATR